MSLATGVRNGMARLLLRTAGRASEGIRISFEHGFTSGKMVDYVYRNEPSGRGWIGRTIDRWYLAHRGWEAVRTRRANLEALMLRAAADLREAERPVRILDPASGQASYILSTLARVPGSQAVCRDLDARWLAEGEAEAARRGLAGIRFERGDAFDREGILAVRPRPTLAAVSGFYDWIVDDAAVRRSLSILHEALEPGGWIVLTHQTAHPDLKLVEDVFVDFNGSPLRMKLRSAAEMDGWLLDAGFEPAERRGDPEGFYAVTRAKKAR